MYNYAEKNSLVETPPDNPIDRVIYNADHMVELLEFIKKHDIADDNTELCCVTVKNSLKAWKDIASEMRKFMENKLGKKDIKVRNECLENVTDSLMLLGFASTEGYNYMPREIADMVDWIHEYQWVDILEISKPSLDAAKQWHAEHSMASK